MVSDSSGSRTANSSSRSHTVSGGSGGWTAGSTTRRRDRAQLLLITAVIIAAFLLSAVVLLNVLHESPETGSAQDSQSIADTERITAHLATDLHRYFLAHSADIALPGTGNYSDNPAENRVPFADRSEFEDSVSAFAASYMNRSVEDRAGAVSVELNDDESDPGAIVWKTDPTVVPQNETYMDGADALPRIQFHIADANTAANRDIEVEADTQELFTIDFQSDIDITRGADTLCEDLNTPFEVDLVHGVGEVRADNQYCRIDVSDAIEAAGSNFNVTVGTSGLDPVDDRVEWTYAISATGASVTDDETGPGNSGDGYEGEAIEWDEAVEFPPLWYTENVLVDPVFDITYVDPSISYEATLRLFEEGS